MDERVCKSYLIDSLLFSPRSLFLQIETDRYPDSTESNASNAVKTRDNTCQLTGANVHLGCQSTHIIPATKETWVRFEFESTRIAATADVLPLSVTVPRQ
jgi:hypothetical protein